MAFVCPEKSQKRQDLLNSLKCLVDQMGDGDARCCPPPSCCPQPSVNSCIGPVIEIYDPLPKPCLPICSPMCPPCCPPSCCPPGCPPACPPCGGCCPPPGCCPPMCTPGTCPPPNASVPITKAPPQPICVPPILPVCTTVPPPCVPICNPNPEEQPCVPCNPPQMMVCYRRPKNKSNGTRSKSRELRASILHVGCDCEKHNGLQDDCPRSECHGSPECLTLPDPTCGPSAFANGKHLGQRGADKKNDMEQYQCYPAYVRLPTCAPCGGNGNGNGGGNGGNTGGSGCPSPCCPSPCCPPCCPAPCCPCPPPCVPLIAQAPCPPPITPGPPPCVPVGRVVPVCPAVPCPIPCPPPMACCPPTNQMQCCPCPPPACCPCPC